VEYRLLYERSGGVRLAGFTDVDWAGCAEDRKSTSGCCFSIGSRYYILVQQEAEISGIELC
jgi:hypothetical protein